MSTLSSQYKMFQFFNRKITSCMKAKTSLTNFHPCNLGNPRIPPDITQSHHCNPRVMTCEIHRKNGFRALENKNKLPDCWPTCQPMRDWHNARGEGSQITREREVLARLGLALVQVQPHYGITKAMANEDRARGLPGTGTCTIE